MKKTRIVYFLVGCFFVIITALFKLYYGSWIDDNDLFDLYLADTYMHLFKVPIIFFIYSSFAYNGTHAPIKELIGIVAGLILYAIIGAWLEGVFDYKDILAIGMGGVLSLGINKYILKVVR
ncbi:hypothetical protein [Bacteroides neonati]|uniref:hypothetical protein n=1 Tax=Bacteroides neonati TaxID=1347393 RepID=UPI0006936F57|nr:hypothetical protein [Bacteroides neonati]